MPWLIYDPKALDKPTSRKLFCMTLSLAHEVPVLSALIYKMGTWPAEKPTDVPEGMALRFFPTSDDIYYAKEWMDTRYRNGEARYVPWQDAEILADIQRPRWATVRHMTDLYMPSMLTTNAQVEYFASYTHMQERRRTTTTIGRFLQTVWTNYDEAYDNWMTRNYGALTDDIIRVWSETPKAQTAEDVKFATTEDDIQQVYDLGPPSCMGNKPKDFWPTGIHPVRAYAGGDLALAWLPKRRDPSKPSQRAMCWPEKKIYSRVYGTGPLERFLKELGYTTGNFHGAKLKKIVVKDNQVVLPYIDYHDYVVERTDHLRIFHKVIEHPWKPGIDLKVAPRTQRAVWAATATTSGAVAIPKCRVCSKITHQVDHNYARGMNLCRKCAISTVTCVHCRNVSAHRKDPSWTWILGDSDLCHISSLDGIHRRKRPLQAMCPTCAMTRPVRRDYHNAGYVWIDGSTGQPVDLTT